MHSIIGTVLAIVLSAFLGGCDQGVQGQSGNAQPATGLAERASTPPGTVAIAIIQPRTELPTAGDESDDPIGNQIRLFFDALLGEHRGLPTRFVRPVFGRAGQSWLTIGDDQFPALSGAVPRIESGTDTALRNIVERSGGNEAVVSALRALDAKLREVSLLWNPDPATESVLGVDTSAMMMCTNLRYRVQTKLRTLAPPEEQAQIDALLQRFQDFNRSLSKLTRARDFDPAQIP